MGKAGKAMTGPMIEREKVGALLREEQAFFAAPGPGCCYC
jgi:hypothetical protein